MIRSFKLLLLIFIATLLLIASQYNYENDSTNQPTPTEPSTILGELGNNLIKALIHKITAPLFNPETVKTKTLFPLSKNASKHLHQPSVSPPSFIPSDSNNIPNILQPENTHSNEQYPFQKIEDHLFLDEQYDDYFNDSTSNYGELNNNDFILNEIEIHAPITHINLTNQSLELSPVTGQPSILVYTDDATQFTNQQAQTFQLEDISHNDFVEIIAYQSENDEIIATHITITNTNPIKIQGTLQYGALPSNIKVLNIEFMINDTTELNTDFYNDSLNHSSNTHHSPMQFIAELEQHSNNHPLIQVQIISDPYNNGIANQVILKD